MKKPKKRKENRTVSYYFSKDWLTSLWRKYWSIIIALAAGVVVGKFILPKFLK